MTGFMKKFDDQMTQMPVVNHNGVLDIPQYTSLQMIPPVRLGWNSEWKEAITLQKKEQKRMLPADYGVGNSPTSVNEEKFDNDFKRRIIYVCQKLMIGGDEIMNAICTVLIYKFKRDLKRDQPVIIKQIIKTPIMHGPEWGYYGMSKRSMPQVNIDSISKVGNPTQPRFILKIEYENNVD